MSAQRFLIVDDHALFRTGLSMILQQDESVAEVIEAGSVLEAKNLTLDLPNLLLLDIQMPGLTGIEGITILKDRFPMTPIIMLSSSDKPQDKQLALAQGAAAFLNKAATAEEIHRVIKQVLTGNLVDDNHLSKQENTLNNKHRQSSSMIGDESDKKLTARQLEVLALICEGKSNKLIARELNVSENTVRGHVSSVLSCLGVSRRSEAIMVAQKQGIISY